MHKLLILATLASASLAPAIATEPAPRSATVEIADLDLGTAAGTRTLDRRIHRAVVEVCGDAPGYDLEGQNEVRQCRRDTRRLARNEAELAIAGARGERTIRIVTAQK